LEGWSNTRCRKWMEWLDPGSSRWFHLVRRLDISWSTVLLELGLGQDPQLGTTCWGWRSNGSGLLYVHLWQQTEIKRVCIKEEHISSCGVGSVCDPGKKMFLTSKFWLNSVFFSNHTHKTETETPNSNSLGPIKLSTRSETVSRQ
jgi:hypothetical protein